MDNRDDLLTLRTRAEQALQEQEDDLSSLSPEEAQHLIHELRVQNKALEIENQELIESDQELLSIQERFETLDQKYTDLYNSAPVGYYTLNEHGVIVEANLTAVAQLNVEKDEQMYRLLEDYVIEEDKGKFAAYLQQAFTEETARIDEIRLQKRNGMFFYVRLESRRIQPDEDDVPLRQITVCDVSELSQARDTLLRRDGELALFNRVSHVFNSSHDLDQILVVLMEEVRRLLEVTACSIWLIDSETQELVCQQAIGPHRDTVLGWRLEAGQGIAGWVASNGKSLIVDDSWADDRHFDGVDRLTGHPLRSILVVPMRLRNKVIGVVQVLDTQPNRFNETDQALQELLAAMAGIAIENARLYDQLRQDGRIRKILLHDLNSRIKATLATTTRLFSTVRRHARLRKQEHSKILMGDMITRMKTLNSVYALLAEFEWNPLPLSELANRIIHSTLESLAASERVTVEVSPSSVRISPEQADNLGIAINELVTNTVKHAVPVYPTIAIEVHIALKEGNIVLEYRDDGPGFPVEVLQRGWGNVGMYLIHNIVRSDLHGEVSLRNDNGAVVTLRFEDMNAG
jgi:PAS domain S-box-containing protein